MSKFERLIYTECRSGIGMNIDGKTPPRTGYGVYSMSEGLLPEGPFRDRVFLESAINLKNSSRLASSILINSYAYYVPEGGMPMLGYYFQRDGSDAPSDRLSQAYINEWVFGKLDCYPADMFTSGYWSAYKKPFTWYIKDAPKPTELLAPVQSNDLQPCSIREEALRFARDGREDLVRKAVLAILQQLSLPANERKFLVIRDSEEKVRLWIAAITYQLPQQAALKISFKTNGTNLNNPQSNVYAYSRSKNSTVRMALQNDGGDCERQFYAMIVGIDPRDSTSTGTTTAQANKSWIVLDGTTLKISDMDISALRRDYFRYMLSDDGVITNFFMDMQEMRNVEPTMKLLDLFDAQMVLQNRSRWTYDALTQALMVMIPHFNGEGRAVLLNYLIKYLCASGGYTAMIERDAENQLKLLHLLRKCAQIAQKTGAVDELKKITYEYTKALIANPAKSDKLNRYCRDLDAFEQGLASKQLRAVMDEGLAFLKSVDLSQASDGYIERIFRMMDEYISRNRTTWGRMWTDATYGDILNRLAERICCSDSLTDSVLKVLSGSREAVDRLILTGGKMSRQNGRYRWLCKRISRGVTLDYICNLLSRQGDSAEVIEELLCARMEQTGPSEEIASAYNRYLSLNSDVGSRYFTTWYRCLSEQKQNPRYFNMLDEILRSATARTADMRQAVKLVQDMDDGIAFEQNEYNRRLTKLVLRWSEKCRTEASRAELWSYVDGVLAITNRRMPMYKRCCSENPNCCQFAAPADFAASSMCQKFLDAALKEADAYAVHAIVLLHIRFEDKAAQRDYFCNWVKRICDASLKSKNCAVVRLFGLYYGQKDSSIRLGRECEQVLENISERDQDAAFTKAMGYAEDYLSQIRTTGVFRDWIDFAKNELNDNAARSLEAVLIRTQDDYRSTHKNPVAGLFNSIFGNSKRGK